jgi:hypothetical protein
MTVEALLKSFPVSKREGKCIPCDDGDYVILRHMSTREQLAIFILYEYTRRKVFLPSTVSSYCNIPETSLGKEYDEILQLFLKKQSTNRHYFLSDKLYKCYGDEMNSLMEDLKQGGNDSVSRELCLQLWITYRTLFRDEAFSTMEVVQANPRLCRLNNIHYAGPLLF